MSYDGPDSALAQRSDGRRILNSGSYQADIMQSLTAASQPNTLGGGSQGSQVPGAQAGFNASSSPAMDLLTVTGLQQGMKAPGGVGLGGYGLGPAAAGHQLGQAQSGSGPFPGDATKASSARPAGEKHVCSFFVRTGTCAYGERCRFLHPLDRPPPQLNSRGYPLRSEEPDCAHYLKKGWCAFGPTCKFNHPELSMPIINTSAYGLASAQPASAFVGASAAYPASTAATAVYSVPTSAVPTLYYLPGQQLASAAAGPVASLLPATAGMPHATQLYQQQQAVLASAAAPQLLYGRTQPGAIAATGYSTSNMGNVMALQEAMQGLSLARASGGAMHLGGRAK